MSQTAIKAGHPKVGGVDPRAGGLLKIEIPLEPTPDPHWTGIFNRGPSGVGYPVSMHPPELVGGAVFISPPDDEVERYVEKVEEMVAATNQSYAEHVEPRLKAQREAAARDTAERRRRVEDAQGRLDEREAS